MESSPEFNQFIDLDYELSEQALTEWVGDGHFVTRTWLWKDGELADEVQFEKPQNDLPRILHTCLRYDYGERNGQSCAHDLHPFISFVHLLRDAVAGSSVYISIPFLTDFMVIDELCHYSHPENKNLQIYILLGPNSSCISSFREFVGHYEDRRLAVSRLHLKQYGWDEQRGGNRAMYTHSKAMVSTAGAMVGSYNYTYASRYRHFENSVFLPRSNPDCDGLEVELKLRWESAGDELVIEKKATPLKRGPAESIFNPYAKRPSPQK